MSLATITLPNWFWIMLLYFLSYLTKLEATSIKSSDLEIKFKTSKSTYLGLIILSGKKVALPKLLLFK